MKRPLLYIATAFSAGIALSALWNQPVVYPILLSALSVVTALLSGRRRVASHACIYLAILFFGAAYYTNSITLPSDDISHFRRPASARILVKGTVIDDPVFDTGFYNTKRTVFLLKAKSVSDGASWNRVSGSVKVVSYAGPVELNFGDEIMLQGTLSEPLSLRNPGVFDYSKYLRLKGIYSAIKVDRDSAIKVVSPAVGFSIEGLAYKLRRWARKAIDSSFDARDSGFLKSIIIGDRAELEEGINDDFIKTGTVHVLAISGLNVAFVAAMCMAIFGILRVPRKLNMVLVAVILIFYAFATGANPPIVRAVIMFAFFTVGYVIGRDSDPLNILSAAGLAILLYDPKTLFDAGFQLSFASIASMIIFAPRITKWMAPKRLNASRFLNKAAIFLTSGIAVSMAAWIGSFPLVAKYFNIVSPVSFIANLLIVPFLSVMTALSFMFLAAQPIPFGLAKAIAGFLVLLDGALFKVNHFMASIPYASFRVAAPPLYLCAALYVTAMLALLSRKKYFLFMVLVSLNLAVWPTVLQKPGRPEMTFLDVGQGDSVFIKTPSGENILIDGASGGDDERFDVGRSVIAPYLWNRGIFYIDAIIATHFHEDHIGGLLYILDNFMVGCVIDNGTNPVDSKLYRRYIEIVKRKKIKRITIRAEDVIGPFGGMRFYVMNPDPGQGISDSNDNSLVLKLKYKDFGTLFCGDVKDSAIDRLQNYKDLLNSDIVKVPHHGGRLGEGAKISYFFKCVSATDAVISVGRYNRYNAPAKDTVDAILSSGAVIHETKDVGAVSVDIDDMGKYKISCFAQKN
jgi:competence protein ComEC